MNDHAAALSLPSALPRFMLENADELEWLLRAAGADEQVATMRCLTDALARGDADTSEAHDVLAELREMLLGMPNSVSVPEYLARPDLATPWIGRNGNVHRCCILVKAQFTHGRYGP